MSRLIHGSGPTPCDWMLVGSQPGHEEQSKGHVYVGRTGQELGRYLDGESLPHRDDIFLTNYYREYKGKDYVYTQDDRAIAEEHLRRELAAVHPTTIIALGREAARYFLGDVDLEDVHGIPFYWDTCPYGRSVVLACYHVAAGFHNADLNSFVAYDFQQAADYFAGRLHARKLYDDPIPQPQYELLTGDDVCRVLRDL